MRSLFYFELRNFPKLRFSVIPAPDQVEGRLQRESRFPVATHGSPLEFTLAKTGARMTKRRVS